MRRDRGVILIAVLGITALAAAIAMEIAFSVRIESERVEASRERTRAMLMAESGFRLAAEAIMQDSGAAVGRSINWNREDGSFAVEILDESARFPFHTLFDEGLLNIGAKTRFERLVEISELEPELIPGVLDYLDPDREPFPGGAEDAPYRLMNPPRRPANRMLYSLRELDNISGVDTPAAEKLRELCRLHGDERININKAPAEVIASLSEEISLDEARRIAGRATVRPYATVADIRDVVSLPPEVVDEIGAFATTNSSLFRVVSTGRSGSTEIIMTTVLERQAEDIAVKYRLLE